MAKSARRGRDAPDCLLLVGWPLAGAGVVIMGNPEPKMPHSEGIDDGRGQMRVRPLATQGYYGPKLTGVAERRTCLRAAALGGQRPEASHPCSSVSTSVRLAPPSTTRP